MKKIVLATVLAALGSASALAADLPARMYTKAAPLAPVSSWAGLYLGGNIGGGWGVGTTDTAFTGAADLINSSLDSKSNGVIGGGQIGYNWQTGTTVFGLEADIQGADIKGNVTTGDAIASQSGSERLSFLGTVRGRLGILATPSVLLYGTAGLAYGSVDYSANATSGGATTFPASVSDTRVGWTVGAGAEWMISHGWSAKLEYLYVDLGSVSATGVTTPAGAATANYTFHTQDHIARVGVNYHFN